jgi:hypothetical protein
MNSKQIFVSALFIMSVLLSGCSAVGTTTSTPTPPASVQNIVDLVKERSITFKVTSGAINELGLEIRNTTDQALQVEIPAGTYFVNEDPKSQNMVVRHPASVSLAPNGRVEVQLAAACANLHLSEPTAESTFTIEGAQDLGIVVGRTGDRNELTSLIQKLDSAGVDFLVEQAAIWIVTDDATFDELGMLVEGSRFGASVINEDDAARAMMLVDETQINIRGRAIWKDRAELTGKVTDPATSAWLDSLVATQAVEDATQAVDEATIEAQVGTEVAQAETKVALEATQTAQAMPTPLFPFGLTNKKYHETDDFSSACSEELGSLWRTADWNDFLHHSQAGNSIPDLISTLALVKNTPYLLTYNGEGWYTGNRHYFLELHNHILPGGWLSHANIDDHYIDLGSWYGSDSQVLCTRE